MSVVVLAEGAPAFETMDEARSLARSLETDLVVIATSEVTAAALKLKDGDKLSVVSDLGSFSADTWLARFAGILGSIADAQVVLIADSAHVRAFFPALALKCKKALLSGATRARIRRSGASGTARLEVERPLHGGLQTERLLVSMPIFVTLLSPGSGSGAAAAPTASAVNATKPDARDVVVRVVPPNAETVDIRSADRIVAGGLGLGSKEAVETVLPRLAKLLHAAVGGTRVISDRGWLEHERYIGSTGKTVAPKLYMALGISGASQHMVGITESEAIVAINTDRAAPIFGIADLGVIGDLHAILPELEKRLTKESSK